MIPTWDLFIIVFFGLIIAYSFIIGRQKTTEVMISSYVAILASDGAGNVISQLFFGSNPYFPGLSANIAGSNASTVIKIILFIVLLIFLVLKSNFVADVMNDNGSPALSVFLTFLMSFFSAALIVSAILVFMSNSGSFLTGQSFSDTTLVQSIYNQSFLAKILIQNTSLVFLLPAVVFLTSSLLNNKE